MKIGIVGTGNMGRALGLRWASGGHQVMFGSRELGKAQTVADSGPASARAGDLDAAAAFGDVILYTERDHFPSTLLQRPQDLQGKIVIDCTNSAILGLDVPDRDSRPGVYFTTPIPSHAERLAADARGARVVKAFNTIAATVIALDRDQLVPHGISVFMCSDDAPAKAVVSRLAEELGFIGIDSGGLERAQLVEALADFIRFQIVDMSRGPFVTLSMHIVPESSPRRLAPLAPLRS